MADQVGVTKNEDEEGPVPSEWRATLAGIVEAFRAGDFKIERSISGVSPLAEDDADRISRNISAYGSRLASLPDEAWDSSVCRWTGAHWEALVDLFTIEDGLSDLVLFVRVYEGASGYQIVVDSVHVP